MSRGISFAENEESPPEFFSDRSPPPPEPFTNVNESGDESEKSSETSSGSSTSSKNIYHTFQELEALKDTSLVLISHEYQLVDALCYCEKNVIFRGYPRYEEIKKKVFFKNFKTYDYTIANNKGKEVLYVQHNCEKLKHRLRVWLHPDFLLGTMKQEAPILSGKRQYTIRDFQDNIVAFIVAPRLYSSILKCHYHTIIGANGRQIGHIGLRAPELPREIRSVKKFIVMEMKEDLDMATKGMIIAAGSFINFLHYNKTKHRWFTFFVTMNLGLTPT